MHMSAQLATEEDHVLRLMLATNKPPLEKLFNGYQLLGSKSRTDTTVSEDQFNTLLARVGVQGTWLSKHDISQVLWMVKSWSLEGIEATADAKVRQHHDCVSTICTC